MDSLIWQRDKEIRAVAIEAPNELHDVYLLQVSTGRQGATFRQLQFPIKDEVNAEKRARELMTDYRKQGFEFKGRGAIDKRKRDAVLICPAEDMQDPLLPSVVESLSVIPGRLSRKRVGDG